MSNDIRVGHRWEGGEYIGRGSPLGNPFRMDGERTRDRVCDQYEAWFAEKVEARDPTVMRELRRLYQLARKGPLTLGCFCAPKRCHGQTIKNYLEKQIA